MYIFALLDMYVQNGIMVSCSCVYLVNNSCLMSIILLFSVGGMPVWLKSLNSTLRTYDQTWLTELSQFVEKTLEVVDNAHLLAKDGGPIIMLQMENEYGNMEKYYGLEGRHYVKWLSEYALSLKVGNIPWVMCQQGEGTGTAPSEKIVNACNGFYCDNWISKHTEDFPNQPHMWTENWPGWFQNWGDAIPHRPAVDVAFAVTRWFARGGTYMNYYMAYGGSTFGRKVGGPLIVTSYDYDVQVNEFSMPAEPKFTLLQQLHKLVSDNVDVLLTQAPPAAVPLAGSSNCESHTYESNSKCIAFFSNWDESKSCVFTLRNGQTTSVLPWSVSIATGSDCSNVVYNTKSSVENIPTNTKSYKVIEDFQVENIATFAEPIPSSAGNSTLIKTIDSTVPLEQIATTGDHTDYLWYSFSAPTIYSQDTKVTLSFSSGSAGGGLFYIFANGQVVGSVLGAAGKPPISRVSTEVKGDDRYPVSVEVTLPAGNVVIDILSVAMGLQNYGPYLEKVMVGIVSDVKIDSTAVHQYKQSVGLLGEAMNLPSKQTLGKVDNSCKLMCWYSASFKTPSAVGKDSRLALELSSSMGKGMVFVNGQMLGRYWNVTAKDKTCQECSAMSYTGSYNGDKCRTGCGSPSQQYYKLPVDWLVLPKTTG